MQESTLYYAFYKYTHAATIGLAVVPDYMGTGSNTDRTGPRGPAHVIITQRRAAKFSHSAPSRAAIFKLLHAEDHDDITVSISLHALIVNNH